MDAVFCWLLAGIHPLKTSAFVDAVLATVGCDTDASRELILDLCFNLVIIDKALDVFRFAHLSVREYIETKSEYEISHAHAIIARGCLACLTGSTHLDTKVQRSSKETFFFYLYACQHWVDHLQLAGSQGHMKPLLDAFFAFCGLGYLHWTRTIRPQPLIIYPVVHKSFSKHLFARGCDLNPVFTAAALGIWEIFELEAYRDLTCFDRDNRGPLTIACQFDQSETVQWLLHHGADPNEQHGIFDDFPLAIVARNGYHHLAQLLIKHGALVNTRTGENGRAFCCAIAKHDLRMASLLLDNGADVELANVYITDEGGHRHRHQKPPIFYAETKETAEFLLERGASPRRTDDAGLNALENAIHQGRMTPFNFWISKCAFELNATLLPLAIDSLPSTFNNFGDGIRIVVQMLRILLAKGAKIDLERCRQYISKVGHHQPRRWIVETTFLEHILEVECGRHYGTQGLHCDECSSPIRCGTYMREIFPLLWSDDLPNYSC